MFTKNTIQLSKLALNQRRLVSNNSAQNGMRGPSSKSAREPTKAASSKVSETRREIKDAENTRIDDTVSKDDLLRHPGSASSKEYSQYPKPPESLRAEGFDEEAAREFRRSFFVKDQSQTITDVPKEQRVKKDDPVDNVLGEVIDRIEKSVGNVADEVTHSRFVPHNADKVAKAGPSADRAAHIFPNAEKVTKSRYIPDADKVAQAGPNADAAIGKSSQENFRSGMESASSKANETIMGGVAAAIADKTSHLSESLLESSTNLAEKIQPFGEFMSNVTEKATQGVSKASEKVSALKDKIPSMETIQEKAKEGASAVAEKIPSMETIQEKAKEGMSMAAEKIPPLASNLKEKASEMLHSQTAENLKEGAMSTFSKVKESIYSMIKGEKATSGLKNETPTEMSSAKSELKDDNFVTKENRVREQKS